MYRCIVVYYITVHVWHVLIILLITLHYIILYRALIDWILPNNLQSKSCYIWYWIVIEWYQIVLYWYLYTAPSFQTQHYCCICMQMNYIYIYMHRYMCEDCNGLIVFIERRWVAQPQIRLWSFSQNKVHGCWNMGWFRWSIYWIHLMYDMYIFRYCFI